MYIVAMGYNGKGYICTKGQYASAVSAIDAADGSGQGYKVYLDGRVFYQQQTAAKKITRSKSKVCQTAKDIIARIKKIISSGHKWVYSNIGCSSTFSSAEANMNYKSNCATMANWVCRALKITHSGQYFYGKAGSVIQWRNPETQASVNERCHVFEVHKTVAQCLAEGALQPGDICCYARQHTNIYAGNSKWYESGTVYADGSGAEGTKLTKFYGATALPDWVISWVIRYNDLSYRPAKREYRVQCGSFAKKANAKELKKKLVAKKIPAIIVTVGNQYIVQVGRFEGLGNAVRMAEQMSIMNFQNMIVGV